MINISATKKTPVYRKNIFQERFRPSPLFPVSAEISAPNGGTKNITFFFANEEDAIENANMGIGIEIEQHLNTRPSTITRMRDPLLFGKCTGKLYNYNPFVGMKGGKRNSIRERDVFAEFDIPGDAKNMATNYTDQQEIYMKVVQANNSILICEEPKIDKTINDNNGGVEIVLSPVSLRALPLVKIEIARIMHYSHLFDMKVLGDTSAHFHVSADMLGTTPSEFENTFTSMVWFLFENKEFLEDFSGRIDSGIDMSSFLYWIGDPTNILSKETQKRRVYAAKEEGLIEIASEGFIDRRKSFQAGLARSDDRVKGLFNMVVRDKYDTVELRWFSTPESTENCMEQYEFCFAFIGFCKRAGVHSTTSCESMKLFVEYVEAKKERFPHLWNKFINYRFTKDFIKNEDKIHVEVVNYHSPELIQKVIDYTIYDEAFVKKYSEPTVQEDITVGESSKAKALLANIVEAVAQEVEKKEDALLTLIETPEIPPMTPIAETVKWKCELTGYESDALHEFVKCVNGKLISKEVYENENPEDDDDGFLLAEEYCVKCGCTMPADDAGCTDSEYDPSTGDFVCSDCVEDEDDIEDEDDEEFD